MKNIYLVMIGGFVGSMLRYGVSTALSYDGFPYATLLVNLFGCFVLGWLLTLATVRKKLHPDWSLMLGTGLLGSFTTFSTFSLETVQLFEHGSVGLALIYVVFSIVIGLLLSYLGVRLALSSGGEQT